MPITYSYEGDLAGRIPGLASGAGYMQGLANARRFSSQQQLAYDQMRQQQSLQQQRMMHDRWSDMAGHQQSLQRIEAQGDINQRLQEAANLANRDEMKLRHGYRMDEMVDAARMEHDYRTKYADHLLNNKGKMLKQNLEHKLGLIDANPDLDDLQKRLMRSQVMSKEIGAAPPDIWSKPGDPGTYHTEPYTGNVIYTTPEGEKQTIGKAGTLEAAIASGTMRAYNNGQPVDLLDENGRPDPRKLGAATDIYHMTDRGINHIRPQEQQEKLAYEARQDAESRQIDLYKAYLGAWESVQKNRMMGLEGESAEPEPPPTFQDVMQRMGMGSGTSRPSSSAPRNEMERFIEDRLATFTGHPAVQSRLQRMLELARKPLSSWTAADHREFQMLRHEVQAGVGTQAATEAMTPEPEPPPTDVMPPAPLW